FLVLGTLPLAFAAGRRQSLRGTRGGNGAPVLFAAVGIASSWPASSHRPGAQLPAREPTVQTTRGLVHGLAGLATSPACRRPASSRPGISARSSAPVPGSSTRLPSPW